MSPTWIEVADTAVKIGLGAVIGGITSYVLATTNHKQVLWREVAAKKIRLLEVACEEAEKFFSYTSMLYNRVSIFARDNDGGERDQTEFETEVITDAHDSFQDAMLARNRALAHVSLLGVGDAEACLSAYSDALERFRVLIAYRMKMPSRDDHEAFIREFQLIKKSFYAATKTNLDKIGGGA